MTLEFLQYFSDNYDSAHQKFVQAADHAQGLRETIPNPRTSPSSGKLVTEVAWFGPRTAERVLMVQSGTHGAEGLCGSGCQVGWLETGGAKTLPPNTAVLMVHLINPFGAAWTQQETEEGVNLNRNFMDFSKPLPKSPLYDEIHEALTCPDTSGARYDAAQSLLKDFRARNGQIGYQKAIFGGQYRHPKGMNFGGTEPTWSNRTFVGILKKYLSNARRVIFLDYHTGLGPYAYASLITFCSPNAPLFKRATEWFGPTIMAVQGDETAAVAGLTSNAILDTLAKAEVTPVTVEYGTYDIDRECNAVVQDHWHRNFGDRNSPAGLEAKRELAEYFYPDAANWKEMVWFRSQQILRNALDALAH
jgi:hypothetical protein